MVRTRCLQSPRKSNHGDKNRMLLTSAARSHNFWKLKKSSGLRKNCKCNGMKIWMMTSLTSRMTDLRRRTQMTWAFFRSLRLGTSRTMKHGCSKTGQSAVIISTLRMPISKIIKLRRSWYSNRCKEPQHRLSQFSMSRTKLRMM